MRKSREIKELLVLLRDNARVGVSDEVSLIPDGLCLEVAVLYHDDLVNFKEKTMLRAYIYANKPYNAKYEGYGWRPHLWKCRLKWLNGQIKSLN